MKRLLPVLACCLARAAAAQISPSAQSNDFVPSEPQIVNLRSDGRCMNAKPGDTVHYTLTIEGVGDVHGVYGDLRLRLGRTHELVHGLPAPDFRSLGGGGLGTRDKGDAKTYHFTFKVPRDIFGGTYRGVEVAVHADEPQATTHYQSPYHPVALRVPDVDVTRHTYNEVRAYCLNVMSNFGFTHPIHPAVTNFEPGSIDPAPPVPPAPKPLPTGQTLPPPQGLPPQPR